MPRFQCLTTTTLFIYPSDGVLVAKIDADANKEKAGKFGIRGFPTLKWFPKGSASDPEDYVGGRQADDMINYINTKTGLSRKLKVGLLQPRLSSACG